MNRAERPITLLLCENLASEVMSVQVDKPLWNL